MSYNFSAFLHFSLTENNNNKKFLSAKLDDGQQMPFPCRSSARQECK